jgi:hypothetical protein
MGTGFNAMELTRDGEFHDSLNSKSSMTSNYVAALEMYILDTCSRFSVVLKPRTPQICRCLRDPPIERNAENGTCYLIVSTSWLASNRLQGRALALRLRMSGVRTRVTPGVSDMQYFAPAFEAIFSLYRGDRVCPGRL